MGHRPVCSSGIVFAPTIAGAPALSISTVDKKLSSGKTSRGRRHPEWICLRNSPVKIRNHRVSAKRSRCHKIVLRFNNSRISPFQLCCLLGIICNRAFHRLITFIYMDRRRHFRIFAFKPFCRSCYAMLANCPRHFGRILPCHVYRKRIPFDIGIGRYLLRQDWCVALNHIYRGKRRNSVQFRLSIDKGYHIVRRVFLHFRYRERACRFIAYIDTGFRFNPLFFLRNFIGVCVSCFYHFDGLCFFQLVISFIQIFHGYGTLFRSRDRKGRRIGRNFLLRFPGPIHIETSCYGLQA